MWNKSSGHYRQEEQTISQTTNSNKQRGIKSSQTKEY
jgi:hypothetical protein